jgi:hypothetical protein
MTKKGGPWLKGKIREKREVGGKTIHLSRGEQERGAINFKVLFSEP